MSYKSAWIFQAFLATTEVALKNARITLLKTV